MPANLENSAVATGLENQFSLWSKGRTMPKNVQTIGQLCSFHILVRLCSKSFKLNFSNMWTEKFQIFKVDLEKAEEPHHWKSKRVPEKHLLLLYWLRQSLWLCGSPQTVGNSSRDGNTQPPDLPPEKSVYRSRSNSWNWTWNNRLSPNWERSTSRLYIVTLLI